VLAMVRRKLRKYKAGKIVVYSNSVPKVKGLVEKLGCQAYHHHAVGKASMLEVFMNSKQCIIVATSPLGMGVNVPIPGRPLHPALSEVLLATGNTHFRM
jgi:superfamily II DNA helicase RecQ